jgi:tetratricopeptide (TPR) repeat protein
MKNLFLSVLILFGGLFQATAQDFYLPSSSKSKKAVKSMHEASELYSNVHVAEGNEVIKQALAEDPNMFLAYVYAGQWANQAERPTILEKALAIDASNFNKAEKIMRVMFENLQKDPKYKPTADMEALVEAYPKSPQANEWAAMHSFYTSRDVEAGLKYAQKVVEMSPKYAPIHNNMGYMYMEKKDMSSAKMALEKYIALAPKEPNAYDSMAEYYAINEDYAKAAEFYDKAAVMGLEDAKERADKARSMMN